MSVDSLVGTLWPWYAHLGAIDSRKLKRKWNILFWWWKEPLCLLGAEVDSLSSDSSLVQQMQSGMFGGGGAAQARAMQQPQPPPQPPVPPLSSSQPSLRAQVPQFLSPQVHTHSLTHTASLLTYYTNTFEGSVMYAIINILHLDYSLQKLLHNEFLIYYSQYRGRLFLFFRPYMCLHVHIDSECTKHKHMLCFRCYTLKTLCF